MMEQIVQSLERIEQIDQFARHSLFKYQRTLPKKYANIHATLQLLHNLIDNFTKKADAFQEQLQNTANIADLDEQIRLHRARISDCQNLSATLQKNLQEKKCSVQQKEEMVNQLRTKLMHLKTENVKKLIFLENKEKELQHQADKQNKQIRKATWKMKTEYSRCQMQPTYFPKDQKNSQLSLQLYQLLDRKKKVQLFIEDIFAQLKTKLARMQRKSTKNGLNGSLMFKMLQNDKHCAQKQLKDANLIIYDVLKRKYKSEKRQQKQEDVTVSEQQFMSYSPYQILGIIELRGGMATLAQAISEYHSS